MYKILLGLILLGQNPHLSAKFYSSDKVKKIEIVDTNNFSIDLGHGYQQVEEKEEARREELKALKSYVQNKMKGTSLDAIDDPQIIWTTLDWVSSQWKHDGMNEAPKNASALSLLKNVHEKNERYRCVEYGFVQAELLQALGYQSRSINLRHKDVAYGGFGMGHVASEVWSNTLNKWIFVDPQFSVYASHGKTFLSFVEIYDLKRQGKFDEIRFHVSPKFLKNSRRTEKDLIDEYRSFIAQYFGYISVAWHKNKKKYLMTLVLEGKDPHLTFQGMGADNYIFTQRREDIYFNMNRTLVTFSFKENGRDKFLEVLSKLKIQSNTDYLKNMHLFAAKPELSAELHHNMPHFDHFEVKIGAQGAWKKADGDSFTLALNPGQNQVFARAVNSSGLAGPTTYTTFRYQ